MFLRDVLMDRFWTFYSGTYCTTVNTDNVFFSSIIVINTFNNVGEISQSNKGVYKDIDMQKRPLYTYSQHDLHAIRETLLKNRNWKQIDYDICKIVCSLRLNRRGCRARKNKMKARPFGVNFSYC